MPFLVSVVGAGMMVLEKGLHPVLGWVGWFPCFAAALLLVLPALCEWLMRESLIYCQDIWF